MPLRPSSDARRLSREEVFRQNLSEGSLRRTDGQRAAAFSLEFIRSLHVSLHEKFGDSARDILYRTGYEWSLQEMLRLNQRLREELGGGDNELWQMDAKFVLDSWWKQLAEAGWGQCTFDLSLAGRNVASAEVKDSVVASVFEGADQPACHLYAGLFAGALSFFERAERHAVEVQCCALGHDSCIFVIGPGSEVDAAESWLEQGITASEILRRLG